MSVTLFAIALGTLQLNYTPPQAKPIEAHSPIKIAHYQPIEALQAPPIAKVYKVKPFYKNRSNTLIKGNTYMPGQCTWYAKSRRPDLPNNLGNADTWASRAKKQGWEVSLIPKKGAIGQVKGRMHVVYVEKVLPKGKVLISEMNYAGPYSKRTIIKPASKYIYIY